MTHALAPSLYDLTHEQLVKQLADWGQPGFRAKQIKRWLYQRFVSEVDEMTDLSKELRGKLRDSYVLGRYTAVADKRSLDGWTRKWLLRAPDGSEIETVLMEYDGVRRTACISSQAGCAMNCSFCATGQMGFLRNLRVGEIVEQLVWVERALRSPASISSELTHVKQTRATGRRIKPVDSENDPSVTNVVMMGMGEPFANYNHVMEAVARMTEPEADGGIGLGARRVTISTVGLVPGIRKFSEEPAQINLAVSLHAGTDELRDQLVPINAKYPLKEVAKAVREYIDKTNRRVSYEWALIDGINDTPAQAEALVEVVRKTFDPQKERRHMIHVNLIPLNPTGGYRGYASQSDRIERFCAVLDKLGIPNTVRARRGIDIAAGCGQLKAAIDNV